jgi:phosphomannomutase
VAVTSDCSAAVIAQFTIEGSAASELLAARSEVPIAQATIDALRVICASKNVIHLRPSGNAPQLGVYVEADYPNRTKLLHEAAMLAAEKRLSCTATFTHREGINDC